MVDLPSQTSSAALKQRLLATTLLELREHHDTVAAGRCIYGKQHRRQSLDCIHSRRGPSLSTALSIFGPRRTRRRTGNQGHEDHEDHKGRHGEQAFFPSLTSCAS